MLKQQTEIQSENEKLKRQVFTKEKLLEAQEKSNQKYIANLRQEHSETLDGLSEEIARHVMHYEEVRMVAHTHAMRILELEDQNEKLQVELTEMTGKRDALDKQLKQKQADYEDLFDKFEKKSMEFINERQAHRLQIEANQRLEEEIKELKR